MAIQISGTTVINDSRQLQNIASADTTTQNTINSFVSGGDVVIPDGAFTFIFDASSASLAAGTYFITFASYTNSYRDFNFPTSNMTGGLFYNDTATEWYAYDGSNWVRFQKNTFVTNTATSINGVRFNVWGWFKCSGTTTVSLSGSFSRLGYRKLD